MHSASTRFNGITLFTFSVLGVMCLLNFAEGYFLFNPKTQVEFKVDSIANFINTSRWDQASIKYSLHADLSSLYTWNVKQLYVYIECEWRDPMNSSTILTDWILELPSEMSQLKKEWTLNISNSRMDYLLRDMYHSLRGNTVKISLKTEYMPIVGFFFKHTMFETDYTMPQTYTNQSLK